MPLDHAGSSDDAGVLARELDRRTRGMLAGVTDGHTHLFPRGFYEALWRWFDAHAWEIAFRGDADATLAKLESCGVSRAVALVYAHKPGVAGVLNAFLGDVVRANAGRVVGMGTVLPGEPGAAAIVHEALVKHGMRGIKLHCHVQRMGIDDPRMIEVLRACAERGAPAVVHCGTAPAVEGYGIDTSSVCSAERAERVLQSVPGLTLVVPHVGADEFDDYLRLAEEYEGLYLDTSMACAEYFDHRPRWEAIERLSHKVLYGSDFPIVPYEADRELRLVARRIVSDAAFERIVRGTAQRVYG